MIADLQPFEEGLAYARGNVWSWHLLDDLRVRLLFPPPDNISFRDRHDREWLRIQDGHLIVRAGYACDGCTNAPTTARNIRAAFLHDALYQFLATNHMPISKDQADLIFYEAMRHDRFLLRGPYYHAVRLLGHLYLQDRNMVFSRIIP